MSGRPTLATSTSSGSSSPSTDSTAWRWGPRVRAPGASPGPAGAQQSRAERVDVQEDVPGEPLAQGERHEAGDDRGDGGEVVLGPPRVPVLAVDRLLRHRDRGPSEEDALERGGDRAGVGHVVAQVQAEV